MQNSYIVDTFLSGLAWMVLIYLYFDTRARIGLLSELLSAHALKVALPAMLARSVWIAIPLMVFFTFLLWRFSDVMVQANASGAGAYGLLITMLLAGLPLIWLNVMLICVAHSRYVTNRPPPAEANTPARGAS